MNWTSFPPVVICILQSCYYFFFICFLHGNNCTLMYLPIESLSKVVIHTYMIPNAAPNNNRRTQKGTKMNCVVCNSPVSVIFISHSLDWEWWCCLAMPRVLYRLSPKMCCFMVHSYFIPSLLRAQVCIQTRIVEAIKNKQSVSTVNRSWSWFAILIFLLV